MALTSTSTSISAQTQQQQTLSTLLYSFRNARDILQSRSIPFWQIDSVVVEDPNQLGVTIRYSIDGQQCQLKVPCTEFLMLAWGDRLQRSGDYQVVGTCHQTQGTNPNASPNGVVVASRTADSQYRVQVEANGKVSCTCPDYANQAELFQQHPALWQLIGGQPRCKHLLAGAGAIGRTDLLNMPTVAESSGSGSVASGASEPADLRGLARSAGISMQQEADMPVALPRYGDEGEQQA